MPLPETAFWNWFAERSDAFREEVPPDLEAEMRRRLHTIHRDLAPEIIPPRHEGEDYELVLTARGVLEGFAAVVRTALAAPAVPGWRVTPFIPRSDEPLEVQVGEHVVLTADDYWFTGHRAGDRAHVQIYHDPTLDLPEETLYGIAFLLIDNAIGEYAAATRLGEIGMHHAAPRTPHAKASLPSPRSVAGSTTSSVRRSEPPQPPPKADPAGDRPTPLAAVPNSALHRVSRGASAHANTNRDGPPP